MAMALVLITVGAFMGLGFIVSNIISFIKDGNFWRNDDIFSLFLNYTVKLPITLGKNHTEKRQSDD